MTPLLMFQDEPQQALAALWDGGRFPHALLVEGAQGSGKHTLAMRAAAMILCRSDTAVPCGHCLSCRKLESGNHPDLTVLDGAGKQQSLGVDTVRQLRADAYVSPHESARRVFLILQAQSLTPQAQNALLKLLEEPPETAYFLLTAPSRGALLETIRSRAVTLTMRELDARERETVLASRCDADADARKMAAADSPTVGQALSALGDETAQRRYAHAAALLRHLLARERYDILCLLAEYERDRDGFLRLLDAVKSAVIVLLTSPEGRTETTRCLRLVTTLEETAQCARQNVGLALLSAVFAGRACSL